MIPSIQTKYAGCHFRSRLEARWAVFFDSLGLPWEYEPERFVLPPGSPQRTYLPDFYLPDTKTWVEVKGSIEGINLDLLRILGEGMSPLPGMEDSRGSDRGLLVLGPMPDMRTGWLHPIIQHRKGPLVAGGFFCTGGFVATRYPPPDWDLFDKTLFPGGISMKPGGNDTASFAYRAGRSARFEHGQEG